MTSDTWNPILYETVIVQAADYSYVGTIVSIFAKAKSKQERFVVEDDNGRLFIHNLGQLRKHVL